MSEKEGWMHPDIGYILHYFLQENENKKEEQKPEKEEKEKEEEEKEEEENEEKGNYMDMVELDAFLKEVMFNKETPINSPNKNSPIPSPFQFSYITN